MWQGEAEPGKFNVAESLKSQLLVPRSLLGLGGGQCVVSVCKSEGRSRVLAEDVVMSSQRGGLGYQPTLHSCFREEWKGK